MSFLSILVELADTREEWGKIECLVAERGKSYETAKGALKHLKSL